MAVTHGILKFLTLAIILPQILGVYPIGVAAVEQVAGPNVDSLTFKSFPILGYEKEIAALEEGLIDFIPRLGSLKEAADLNTNKAVKVLGTQAVSTELSCIFFNLRRSPCNDSVLRRTISMLVDRSYICNTRLNGSVNPIDIFVPSLSTKWTNLNASAPGFSTEKARKTLDDSGYKLNALGWRLNPVTGKPVEELNIVTPTWSSDPILWEIGYTISYYSNAVGLPARHTALSDYSLFPTIMYTRDYDICVADITLSQAPYGLYQILHSSRDVNGTYAYSGVHDAKLDGYLDKLWYSVDPADAQKASNDIQAKLVELVPYVPVCSVPRISVVGAKWQDLVTMKGYGAVNMWTYLNVRQSSAPYGGDFKQGVLGGFKTLNPVSADNLNDWSVLQQIFSPLFTLDPVSLQEAPVLAKEWITSAWTNSQGVKGMKVIFKLRSDVTWHDGVQFTSKDVKYCIDFLKKNSIARYETICSKIVEVKTPDEATVEIYLNEPGYRLIYDLAGFTFMPEHIWSGVTDYESFKPWSEANPSISGLTKLVGQGPYIFNKCDLGNYVELVWNPQFFLGNPERPGLVEASSAPKTGITGDMLTFSYVVKNQTGAKVTISNSSYKVTILKADKSTVLEQKATIEGDKYSVKIDSGKLAPGEYTCVFTAVPYGTASTLLTVQKSTIPTETPTPTPSTTPSSGIPGYSLETTTIGIILALILLTALKSKEA